MAGGNHRSATTVAAAVLQASALARGVNVGVNGASSPTVRPVSTAVSGRLGRGCVPAVSRLASLQVGRRGCGVGQAEGPREWPRPAQDHLANHGTAATGVTSSLHAGWHARRGVWAVTADGEVGRWLSGL